MLVLLLSEVLEPGVQELEDTHLLFALLLAFTERTLKVYLEPALTQLENHSWFHIRKQWKRNHLEVLPGYRLYTAVPGNIWQKKHRPRLQYLQRKRSILHCLVQPHCSYQHLYQIQGGCSG